MLQFTSTTRFKYITLDLTDHVAVHFHCKYITLELTVHVAVHFHYKIQIYNSGVNSSCELLFAALIQQHLFPAADKTGKTAERCGMPV